MVSSLVWWPRSRPVSKNTLAKRNKRGFLACLHFPCFRWTVLGLGLRFELNCLRLCNVRLISHWLRVLEKVAFDLVIVKLTIRSNLIKLWFLLHIRCVFVVIEAFFLLCWRLRHLFRSLRSRTLRTFLALLLLYGLLDLVDALRGGVAFLRGSV